MDNRKYNIYFNTHTVSGIIICAILYVMFFAGSFSFFKDDMTAWQKNDSQFAFTGNVKKNYNYIIDSLGRKHKLKGRDFDFTMLRNEVSVYVSMSASHDTTLKKQKGAGRFGGGHQESNRGASHTNSQDTLVKRRNGRRHGSGSSKDYSPVDVRANNRTGYAMQEGRNTSNDTTVNEPEHAGRHRHMTSSTDTSSKSQHAFSRQEGHFRGEAVIAAGKSTALRPRQPSANQGSTGNNSAAGNDTGSGRRSLQAQIKQERTASNEVREQGKKDSKKEGGRRRGRRGDDDSAFFTYDFSKHQEADFRSGYTIGEFLYRLHFLAQLNQVIPFRIGVPFGYMLAGIVSLIFLFALITGLLLHWDKLVSNFFTFRPWNKWKTVWTDLHTVLGVIGFPYQLVFAVTGVILIFNSFLIVPYTKLFYKGNEEKIYKDLGFGIKSDFAYTYQPLKSQPNLDSLVAVVENKWKSGKLSLVAIRNFGDANMHVIIQGKPRAADQMNGQGEWVYRVRDKRVISERSPMAPAGYFNTFRGMIYHLHFGDYGGRPLRVIYFVLGILGCVVINSGVMIWLVARAKNNVPERKRKFNFWIANIYLASSLSMLPVTGLTMFALLFIKDAGQTEIYHWFFYSWLVLSVYFLIRKNLEITNSQSTLLSSVICFAVPLSDGFLRENWFWNTYNRGAFDILFIDVLFFVLAVISGLILWKILNKKAGLQTIK